MFSIANILIHFATDVWSARRSYFVCCCVVVVTCVLLCVHLDIQGLKLNTKQQF